MAHNFRPTNSVSAPQKTTLIKPTLACSMQNTSQQQGTRDAQSAPYPTRSAQDTSSFGSCKLS